MGADKETVKQRLLQRKHEIELSMERLAEARAVTESEEVQDPLDQATKSSLEDLNISLEEHERSELERINQALALLTDGVYGICIDCKRPIAEKRLEMYPNATRCIACQEKREFAS